MKNIALFILFISSFCFSQEDYFLTPQDKAYLFHTVRKSPILERSIGRYIEYTGREVKLPNGELHYDSIELLIINSPDLLRIYNEEIRKAPKGILAEAANKQAIWELNKTLKAYRDDELDSEGLTTSYEKFESLLIPRLPSNAVTKKDEAYSLNPKLLSLLNPSLAFNDKVAMIDGYKNWSIEDKKQFFDALNFAINKWVEDRAYIIFTKLGGEADLFINRLTAAGDGSLTSGLFEEREKDERGRWNKGLPRAIGLFPYETEILELEDSRKKSKLSTMRYTMNNFETVAQGKRTNIHLDVWGYNSEKQTTVVIEKLGKSYPLFGSTESRFLSPDSSFAGKTTYYTMINRVEDDKAFLEDKISGKKGLDYWIDYHKQRKDDKLLEIDKTERDLSDLRQSTITTNDKTLKTKSRKRKRKKKQESVVLYYGQLKAIKKKIAELEEKKAAIIDQINIKEQQLNHMYDLIGRDWVPFKENDGLFVFEDSSTFDLYTQEFSFKESIDSEPFEVRLIAIPYSHTSDQVDEVMLHINITDAIPNYDAKVQLTLNDVFKSNDYKLIDQLFSKKDSISIMEFFDALQDNELDFNIVSKGNGIGKWNGFKTVKDPDPVPMISYPGKSKEEQQQSKMDSSFVRLRTSYIEIALDREINLYINSYTDPVKSNFKSPSATINQKVETYNLSNNEVLSAYRTYSILNSLRQELNIIAGEFLPREEAKTVIDRLNKKVDKSKIYIGSHSFKFKDFE